MIGPGSILLMRNIGMSYFVGNGACETGDIDVSVWKSRLKRRRGK